MMVQKIKMPQGSLKYNYDSENDILDVFIGKAIPVISEEVYSGVYEYFDVYTDELVGVSIIDYKNRDIEKIKNYLPFDICFK